MSIIRVLFELFVIYLLYKLIFEFIIPVYQTTKQVKRKMDEASQRMQQEQQAASNPQYTKQQSSPVAPPPGDYIDYEEIK
ncbi:MAG: hypothetical protein JST02_03165 [Bacteroidetes bacterium]|nr:hypothetical protein [Bacteroidota bacterium]